MTMTKTIEYPTIKFDAALNKTAKMKNYGYAVKDWLCVGWSDSLQKSVRVYNCFGFPVTTLKFPTWNDAVQMAEFLDKHYGDYYFGLWLDNPQANVVQLTQYSIPDGQLLYSLLQVKHENRIVEYDGLVSEYEQSRLSV